MPQPILDIKGVNKSFGGLQAVNDVSLSVEPGEIFGIAGPNGSGKSTLFNLITGIPYGPTSGEVHFLGNRIDRWPAHKIARAGLCRTFQKDAEFPDLSARESILISGVYCGVERNGLADRIDGLLDDLEFAADRRDMNTADLSVYEKKQLMIATALISKPHILMLDEPASGLTKPEIAALDDLLLSVNRGGVTIVLIEHVLSLLLSLSQRLLVLNHGAVIAAGDPSDVVKQDIVIEAYLGGRAN